MEAVRVSLLEHLAQGAAVLSPEVGVFLDVSHRMHPRLCEVVGTLAYEGELQALRGGGGAARGPRDRPCGSAGGWSRSPRGSPGCPWSGDEAQAASSRRRRRPRRRRGDGPTGGRTALAGRGPGRRAAQRPREPDQHAAPGRVKVGTVDRFQGKQAHVVVFARAGRPRSPATCRSSTRSTASTSRSRAPGSWRSSSPIPTRCSRRSEPEHLRLASRFATVVRGRTAPRG